MNLINRTAVKKYLLEQAQTSRAHKFTRVAKEALDEINERVRQCCVNKINTQPSKGKTIL